MTPGTFDWTVPAGVSAVQIEVNGAQGGDGEYSGGLGGRMIANFQVTPGDVYKLHVGGRGDDADSGGAGGLNGGGAGGPTTCWRGGGGGGASDVRTSGDALAERILVAGGGGSGVGLFGGSGGAGGGDTPTRGGDFSFTGGAPASSSAGGTGGHLGHHGATGSLGVGGDGGGDPCIKGGGGGGGYYGGGGGSADSLDGGGGGGGGSAYVAPSGDLTVAANGVQSGDGAIVLSYTVPPTTTTTTTTTVPAPAPKPKADCPTPVPGLRVYPNAFSVQVAAHLMHHCGATAREVQVHSEKMVVLDPPAGGWCPTWRAVRVVAERNSVLIAAHLMHNCRYTATMQREGRNGASVWVVPSGWPTGARAFA